MITIEELINIGKIIKEDNLEWVNDTHTEAELMELQMVQLG